MEEVLLKKKKKKPLPHKPKALLKAEGILICCLQELAKMLTATFSKTFDDIIVMINIKNMFNPQKN